MNIAQSTHAYEVWLKAQVPVIESDLELKHRQMAVGVFPFLRSTFYRWSGLWSKNCHNLDAAPQVLGVGDLHIENFGTWRDAEGRLIWGINDFDEATIMPYGVDLVRLSVSALLAIEENALSLAATDVCDAIIEGYGEQLKLGGKAIVLEEEHVWLRDLAQGADRDPVPFWTKMNALPDATPLKAVQTLLEESLPPAALLKRFTTRTAGLGSLGRPRYVALASWHDGMVAREAKAMLPSAWNWAQGVPDNPIRCGDIVAAAIRCPDPCLTFAVDNKGTGGWVVRRLAPRCSRVELSNVPRQRDERKLLKAMGRETANVHLGTPGIAPKILADLEGRHPQWLRDAAQKMAQATRQDWQDWTH